MAHYLQDRIYCKHTQTFTVIGAHGDYKKAFNIMLLVRLFKRLLYFFLKNLIVLAFKISGPPRMLMFHRRLNVDILKAFGATIGNNNVRIHSPLILHEAEKGYANLIIADDCILNGNIYLDLSSCISIGKGVSIGPSVTIMTHNSYNYNSFLEDRLIHTCGKKSVVIKEGAGIKAGALITMGVSIGKNAVVAGGAVVNRDVPDNSFVAGVPARVLKEIN